MNYLYPVQLCRELGSAWRWFWFSQASDLLTAKLRIAIGMFAMLWLYSFSSDVTDWFGPNGIVRPQAVRNIEAAAVAPNPASEWRYSLLDFCTTDSQVSTVHIVAFALVASFTIGFATPFTSLASIVVVSTFIQRAPILFGATEHMLLAALIYLAIAPCGKFLSLDSLLARRRGTADIDDLTRPQIPDGSVRSNVCLRLIQVHLAIVLLYSGLAKLSGIVWWNGDAVWWMLVQPESALLDFSRLGQGLTGELAMNTWTYTIVMAELLTATFVWFRATRPLIVGLAILVYLSLIPLTGLVGYCCLIIVLLSSFLFHPGNKGFVS